MCNTFLKSKMKNITKTQLKCDRKHNENMLYKILTNFVTSKGQKTFVTNNGRGKNCDQQRPGKKLWPAMARENCGQQWLEKNYGQQWPGKNCQLMSLPAPPPQKSNGRPLKSM